MTQTDRVIQAARSYRGVCAVDFLAPNVIDDGTPITRLAARIQDAEAAGHVFEIIGTRSKTRVYRWVSGPEIDRAVHTPPSPPVKDGGEEKADPVGGAFGPGRLFEAPVEGAPHWKAA